MTYFGIKMFYRFEVDDRTYTEVCKFLFTTVELAENHIPVWRENVTNLKRPLMGSILPDKFEVIDFQLK